MGVDMLHDGAQRIPVEKADGEPGRIGRKTENIKSAVGIKPQFLAGKSVSQPLDGGAQGVIGQALGRRRAEQQSAGIFPVIRVGALSPADHGRVSDTLHTVPVSQQIIQRGGVGKGSVFADRRVQALFFAVGLKGIGVKRDQGSAAGLCAGYAHDGRMNCFRCIRLAGHQTLCLYAIVLVIVCLPCRANGRILLRKLSIHPENQICAFRQVVPTSRKGGMLGCLLRLPGVKKGQDRFCRHRIHFIQKLVVQLGTGAEALQTSFRLSFAVNAQKVTGIVP